jgi:xylulokinase
MSDGLVISIDSSTTGVKAIAWDRTGRAVAEGRATHPMRQPAPGWHEQSVDDWWVGACKAIGDCVGQVDARQIEALGLTHQRETFAPVDRQGVPLRNAILWSDERSSEQLAWLEATFGNDALHRLTGKPSSMTQSLPKIVWLLQNEAEIAARAHKFLDVHAYLVFRLTGDFRTSLASADPMGMVDMANRRWASDLIAALGLREDQFCELTSPGEMIGRVSSQAARETGLPEGLPVIAGAGDGQCAGLGANAIGHGRAYLNLGTGVASGALSRAYLCDRAFRTLYAPLPDAFFVEHVLRGGVYTLNWFIRNFANDLLAPGQTQPPEAVLEAAAAELPPGAQGLMAVPYWNSVMSPYWDAAATGVTIGWTGVHGREHFYRALLEGVAFEQRLVGDAMMQAAGQDFSEYVAVGGGSRSDLWLQIIADVTGTPVVRSNTVEATCLGAAIVAAVAAGWFADAEAAAQAMTSISKRFEPQTGNQAIYERLYRAVYQPLFPAVQDLVDRLTELTRSGKWQMS